MPFVCVRVFGFEARHLPVTSHMAPVTDVILRQELIQRRPLHVLSFNRKVVIWVIIARKRSAAHEVSSPLLNVGSVAPSLDQPKGAPPVY